MYMSEKRQQEVLAKAQEIMRRAAPGILSVPQVSQHIQDELEMGKTSARRYLYLNTRAEKLIELRPDAFWRVTWPAAEHAAIGDVRLCVEMYEIDEKHQSSRLVLTPDHRPGRTRKVGPEGVVYLVTREHATAFVNSVKRAVA